VVAAAAAKGATLAPDQASRAFWCTLGDLYAAARTEAMRLGHAAKLGPDLAESTMLMNVRSVPHLPSCSQALSACPLRLWPVSVFSRLALCLVVEPQSNRSRESMIWWVTAQGASPMSTHIQRSPRALRHDASSGTVNGSPKVGCVPSSHD
jgi:hypothetical protein